MTPERFRKLNEVLDRRQPDLTVLTEEVHKTHNISALVRSCDAVGVGEIHAISSGGEFRRHHMIEGGAGRWVNIRLHDTVEAAIECLHSDHYQVFAAHFSDNALDYRMLDYTGPTAIVLGSELDGISTAAAQQADGHIVIPMRGMTASLNVSVANALILYEAARQREAAGLYQHCRLDPQQRSRLLFEWCYPDIAERCRARNLPYPRMGEDGMILENPLGGLVR